MRSLILVISLLTFNVNAASISGQGTWETTLQGRDLDGNLTTTEAYYDTVLGITWMADTKLIGSNSFGLSYGTELDTSNPARQEILSDGRATWDGAMYWLGEMNSANYGGTDQWRLPTMVDTGISGCNLAYTGTDCGWNVQTGTAATTIYSEMAGMFYDTLGNLSRRDTSGIAPQLGWGLTNTGPFDNIHANFTNPKYYWTGLEYELDTNDAWNIGFSDGLQYHNDKVYESYVWVVHSGDVGIDTTVVPVPAAVWLFGSGLLGLIGFARHKN